MPAIDQCEEKVINALRKDGWQVVDNPYPIRLTEYYNYAFADLRCQRRVNGVSQQVIVVDSGCAGDRLRTGHSSCLY